MPNPYRDALQALVSEIWVICYDNPNGGYESTCPCCYNMESGSTFIGMADIRHYADCAYEAARRLLSSQEPE